MNEMRVWYPFTFKDRDSRSYRISFRIAEEATWDHRFHDIEGHEIATEDLRLAPADLQYIQASCDSAVGSARGPSVQLLSAGHHSALTLSAANHA